MIPNLYVYRAVVTGAYDADTIDVRIDLGLRILTETRLRLYGINAPEMRGSERHQGTVARDALRAKILGKEVYIETHKDKTGKFGRWLAVIWEVNDDGSLVDQSINDWLVSTGYAVLAKY